MDLILYEPLPRTPGADDQDLPGELLPPAVTSVTKWLLAVGIWADLEALEPPVARP